MRSFILFIFLMALCGAAFGQLETQPSWAVTLETNKTAQSNLAVINQCRQRHKFEIRRQNIPFLSFERDQVQLNGGQTVNVPARFSTMDLQPGVFRGQVLVICLTCRSEATCTQDREVLNVVLTVVPPNQSNVNQNNQNQTNPNQNNANDKKGDKKEEKKDDKKEEKKDDKKFDIYPPPPPGIDIPDGIKEEEDPCRRQREYCYFLVREQYKLQYELDKLREAAAATQARLQQLRDKRAELADKLRKAMKDHEDAIRRGASQEELNRLDKLVKDAIKALGDAYRASVDAEDAAASENAERNAKIRELEKKIADLQKRIDLCVAEYRRICPDNK